MGRLWYDRMTLLPRRPSILVASRLNCIIIKKKMENLEALVLQLYLLDLAWIWMFGLLFIAFLVFLPMVMILMRLLDFFYEIQGCPHKQSPVMNLGVLIDMVKSIFPPLTSDAHKGQAGRIAIIGGCQEYTGAPYFAAISALKLGADLLHVFCTKDAGPVIKSYSPELIVHPILDSKSALSEINNWLPRFHSLVIGPGLGRNKEIFETIKAIIEAVKLLNIPLVIDADGLFFLNENIDVIKNYTKAILTPNAMEFNRLFETVVGIKPDRTEPVINVLKLCRELGNVTIVEKGLTDIVADGNNVLICSTEGSYRRCGGQGDLLSGSLGTFTHWSHLAYKTADNLALKTFGPTICAAYGACLLTRECNRQAFQLYGRSMTTSDMINKIHEAVTIMFD